MAKKRPVNLEEEVKKIYVQEGPSSGVNRLLSLSPTTFVLGVQGLNLTLSRLSEQTDTHYM
jgi:hypothetical protein